LYAYTNPLVTPPSDEVLNLVAIPDANQDRQNDFLITYPDGQQQVLFYLGIAVQ